MDRADRIEPQHGLLGIAAQHYVGHAVRRRIERRVLLGEELRMRFTFADAGAVVTYIRPLVHPNQTGMLTGQPSRCNVVIVRMG